MKINYSELVSAYYENLNENLRHFRGGPGFLETWVHDEDHARSLLAILDLAHADGLSELEIALPPGISFSLEWLRREAASLGQVELNGSALFFRRGGSALAEDEFASVHPAYRAALREAQKSPRHAFTGHQPAAPGEIWRSAHLEGAGLHLRVNSEAMVTAALHESKGTLRPMLDRLAALLVGRPLQEGVEHGVIRLERSLRDPQAAPPVKGVVTPENADPLFVICLRLVRGLAAGGENAWRDPLPEQWLSLVEEEKSRQAAAALKAALADLGLPDPGLELVGLKSQRRLVVTYPSSPANKYWHYHLIDLERALRARLGFDAEIQLEDIADRNKRVERTKRAEG
jgi:hypothetical protein